MKKLVLRFVQAGLFFLPPLFAQPGSVSPDLFPAPAEFAQLRSIQSQSRFDSIAGLAKLPEGPLIAEVGFEKYDRRVYAAYPAGNLTIEVIALKDSKGAYSLLTLLGKSGPAPGPPGDFVSSSNDRLLFTQGNILVRIHSNSHDDLIARVARSVSGRIKQHEPAPGLIARMPKMGLDASSLRYYLGPRSFASHGHILEGIQLGFQQDAEVAQARYSLQDQAGVLSLMDFPTSELALDYYERFRDLVRINSELERQVYFKRAGSLLAVLAGSFEPLTADKILGSMNVTYSIQWILDKKTARSGSGWGIPGGLLGTVLSAIILTGILCLFAICAGVLVGGFRFLLRGFAPNNPLDRPERTEIIRLKIDED